MILAQQRIPTNTGAVVQMTVKCNFCGEVYAAAVRTFSVHPHGDWCRLAAAAACCRACKRSEARRERGRA